MRELTKNLEKNGFSVYFAKDKTEALTIAKRFLEDVDSVGFGGSTTVVQIGLLDYVLEQKNIKTFNQYEKGIDMQENIKRRREGMLADLYITGCNAITENGELVNADGSGNRVAAQIFGPKKVLLVVGINKIVPTLEDGFKRIMNIAAVKNIQRLNAKAKEMGKEEKYNINNIANKFAYINGDEKNRTHIILINEELGY
ncbi:MAG: lactate utilization protein [Epsilonproteobacteria bacterium]|nr:lactate utilization protein [Campylobacterota bacterium]